MSYLPLKVGAGLPMNTLDMAGTTNKRRAKTRRRMGGIKPPVDMQLQST
jgi:hypothetical protein